MWRVLHVGLIAGGAAAAVPARCLGRVEIPAPPQSGAGVPPVRPSASGPALRQRPRLILSRRPARLPRPRRLRSPRLADDAAPPALSNTVSILSATYTGTVQDKVAQFDATLQIATTATNQIVPLFGEDVALESFAAKGEAQAGARRPHGGRAAAGARQRSPSSSSSSPSSAATSPAVSLPSASRRPSPAASAWSLTKPRRTWSSRPRCPSSAPAPTSRRGSRPSSAPAERLELNWTPRVKRAAEIVATVFVQNTALVTIGGGVMNTRATLDYQISQGELKQVRVQIPAGQRLLRVEGEAIRSWEIKDDTLVVDLLKGVSPAWKLTVETEKVLEKLPATAEGRAAARAGRETRDRPGGLARQRGGVPHRRERAGTAARGCRGVPPRRAGQEGRHPQRLPLPQDRLQPERARRDGAAADRGGRCATACRSARSRCRWPRRSTTPSSARGCSRCALALPAGYRLESVTGDKVSQWVERDEDGAPLVEVTLKERTLGAYTLNLALAQNYRQLPRRRWPSRACIRSARRSSAATSPSPPTSASPPRPASFEGLTEIPFASVPGERAASGGSALAYKFIAAAPGAAPAWKLSVTTEAVEPWLRAEIMNTITLTETLVSGRTLVKYDIANAPGEGVPRARAGGLPRTSRSPARKSAAGTRPTASGASSCKARCAGSTC